MPAQSDTGAACLALRVDVDTHDGMCDGVPRLLEIFGTHNVHATFYFAMGPDRSGLAVFNLLKPGFLKKMRSSGAAKIYSKRTMLSGTLLPSRPVGSAFPDLIRRTLAEGHEAGVHAWDHRKWQDRLMKFSPAQIVQELDRGYQAFQSAAGEKPKTFAAPAWLSRDESILHEEDFGLTFASDCRGREPFLPVIGRKTLRTPQVPATLPTLDEALGTTHMDPAAFFSDSLRAAAPGAFPVFTLHAELEGGPYARHFSRFLEDAKSQGIRCAPLGEVLAERLRLGPLPACPMVHASIPNRHGVVSMQAAAQPAGRPECRKAGK
jgi:undecaprenyl phosphate-alpha-L-ara4FN deformylase